MSIETNFVFSLTRSCLQLEEFHIKLETYFIYIISVIKINKSIHGLYTIKISHVELFVDQLFDSIHCVPQLEV
jgi:hypothetical protein